MIEAALGLLLVLIVVAGAAAGCIAAIVAMKKDRGRHGSSGQLSQAMLEMEALFEPSRRHVAKTVREKAPEASREGADDPDGDEL